jgi:polyisoprenoid-binding protein YceI
VKRFLLASLAVCALAPAAVAAPTTLAIDRGHSEVGFNIRHFFTKVHGQFTDFDGTVVYDPQSLTTSRVEVTIRDTSINTANDRRDPELRGEDFFWVAKYPLITFKSTKVTPGADAQHFQVLGDLTIRGITKPVTLNVEFLGMGTITQGLRSSVQAGFEATTTINRKDWGIVWNQTVDQGGVASVMLSDDVDLVLNVAAREQPKAAAATTPAPAATTVKK